MQQKFISFSYSKINMIRLWGCSLHSSPSGTQADWEKSTWYIWNIADCHWRPTKREWGREGRRRGDRERERERVNKLLKIQYRKWNLKAKNDTCLVTQSWLTLSDSIDCSPLGSSVHGISQARILEWMPFPTPEIFETQGLNQKLQQPLHCRQILSHWAAWKAPKKWHIPLVELIAQV